MCNNLRVFFFHWKSSNLVFPIPTINPILSKYINYYSSNPLQNNRQRRILFIDRCYFCFHLLREYIRSRREKSQRLTKLTSQNVYNLRFSEVLSSNKSFFRSSSGYRIFFFDTSSIEFNPTARNRTRPFLYSLFHLNHLHIPITDIFLTNAFIL